MNTHTAHPRIRRLALTLALTSSAVAGSLAFSASAVAAPADSATEQVSVSPSSASAAANVVYYRWENIIGRWAVNTGKDHGSMSEGENAQLWSWTHRDPHDWNSQWDGTAHGGGYWSYRNRWSGKCLGVSHLGYSADVEQQTCTYSDGQKWDDIKVGKSNGRNEYVLKNKGVSEKLFTDMVLDAEHTGFGAPLKVNVRNDFSDQRFYWSSVSGPPSPNW